MRRPFSRPIRSETRPDSHTDSFGVGIVRQDLGSGQGQGGGDAIICLELSRGVLAMLVDRAWADAESTSDLLRIVVGVNETQALPLTFSQPIRRCRHSPPPQPLCA